MKDDKNMLCHLLIKLHNLLSLRMKHLDERLDNFQTIIDEKFPKKHSSNSSHG